jgi:hypothetical protein
VSRKLRVIAPPFLVAPPGGVRVRTRLGVSPDDETVLRALGSHLGRLAGADLARRCGEGRLDAQGAAASRRARKQSLTSACSSRWAGAITRSAEDAWRLGERNLVAEARSLRARVSRLRRRLAVPSGGRRGRTRGYGGAAERFDKQRRLQVLQARLVEVEARLALGRVSICRGGRSLARGRHHLDQAGLSEAQWRDRWEAARWFITADGEADKARGNETIRWQPEEGWLEVKLPAGLAHLANRPHRRYRLSVPVSFPYRGDQVAAQAATGALRYDIVFRPDRSRWYLDASWKTPATEVAPLDELRRHPVLAVDVNAGHLAAVVVDPSGNPVGAPVTVPLELAGLPTSTRDGRLRAGISGLIAVAEAAQCQAVVIEDLDFDHARIEGRERHGRRPSRGRRGRAYRRLVAGIPTARFRDRLAQMATNRHLGVVAVDPAYTSQWGAEHWLGALRQLSSDASGHHGAAVVIGRRGLGQRARRREWCDSTRPEDRQERATNSAVRTTPDQPGLTERHHRKPGHHKARGQPTHRAQDPTGRPAPPGPPGDPRPFGATRHRQHQPTLTDADESGTVLPGA